MLDRSTIEAYFRNLSPEQLRDTLAGFLPPNATREERIRIIEDTLGGPAGELLRAEMARWIVDRLVPVKALVPEEYAVWHQPVRDAMLFVPSHLSVKRLATKLQEQLELPAHTPGEIRLLQLIAKVPGLQKLGQVLARNRKLRPSLRKALSELENGIRDVTASEVRAIVEAQLGPKLKKFAVEIEPEILSEASVSAVVRFTWRNPANADRERGVFKVLKPYIPECFAEDMELLQQLADYFGARHQEYGFARHTLTDTFSKVRRLLQHEVDFRREQSTLVKAHRMYETLAGVRVPRLIRPLCTSVVTAITEERGTKVTNAVAGMSPRRRRRVAERLVESLIAVPLFTSMESAMFHADPHAGNLLYDQGTDELILLDWALTERLSRKQRRHLALLIITLGLRDPIGVTAQIVALTEAGEPTLAPTSAAQEWGTHVTGRGAKASPLKPTEGLNGPPSVKSDARGRGTKATQEKLIRGIVDSFIEELPLTSVPGAVDAMSLLETVAVKGVRFPAPLIMFSKVMFTLDGVVHDIGGPEVRISYVIARHLAERWVFDRDAVALPLVMKDWMTVQRSALFYGSRLWIQCQQAALDRLLPRPTNPSTV